MLRDVNPCSQLINPANNKVYVGPLAPGETKVIGVSMCAPTSDDANSLDICWQLATDDELFGPELLARVQVVHEHI